VNRITLEMAEKQRRTRYCRTLESWLIWEGRIVDNSDIQHWSSFTRALLPCGLAVVVRNMH